MTNNEQFTQMFRKSRENSGKSQDYVAKAMGISKKTVQNWESGYSCPDLAQGLEWFKVLGLQPLPYFMDVLYPNLVDLHTEDDLNNALCSLIKDFSTDYTDTQLLRRKRVPYSDTLYHRVFNYYETVPLRKHSPTECSTAFCLPNTNNPETCALIHP